MDWTIPCKQATALMVAREDRTLNLGERAALRWHLLLCKGCTRFEGQMLTMRHALDGWRNYRSEHPDTNEPASASAASTLAAAAAPTPTPAPTPTSNSSGTNASKG